MTASIKTTRAITTISAVATPVAPKWIALAIRITAPSPATCTGGFAIHRRRGSV
ncbi:MAG: hypothetical protein ACR2IP_09600 [Solirubrobacteraceae bacterium]